MSYSCRSLIEYLLLIALWGHSKMNIILTAFSILLITPALNNFCYFFCCFHWVFYCFQISSYLIKGFLPVFGFISLFSISICRYFNQIRIEQRVTIMNHEDNSQIDLEYSSNKFLLFLYFAFIGFFFELLVRNPRKP